MRQGLAASSNAGSPMCLLLRSAAVGAATMHRSMQLAMGLSVQCWLIQGLLFPTVSRNARCPQARASSVHKSGSAALLVYVCLCACMPLQSRSSLCGAPHLQLPALCDLLHGPHAPHLPAACARALWLVDVALLCLLAQLRRYDVWSPPVVRMRSSQCCDRARPCGGGQRLLRPA